MAVKKQSSDWSSSGWDADDSWSNEKEGQGQSSAGEEGWGNDWGEEEADTAKRPLPEGVRLASEYNWDTSSTGKGSFQNDLFASVSQRNNAASTVRAQWVEFRMKSLLSPELRSHWTQLGQHKRPLSMLSQWQARFER